MQGGGGATQWTEQGGQEAKVEIEGQAAGWTGGAGASRRAKRTCVGPSALAPPEYVGGLARAR